MNDAEGVRGSQCRANLLDDGGDQGRCQAAGAKGELLQRLAVHPFEGEIVHPFGFAPFIGLHDVGVLDPGPELGFAQEPFYGDRILPQTGAQDLEGRQPALGMLGAIDGSGTALADVLEEAVSRYGSADEVVLAHEIASKITPASEAEQAYCLTLLTTNR
jgi:hypothetical protein